jgi:uroporphyrinogen decarboxylase
MNWRREPRATMTNAEPINAAHPIAGAEAGSRDARPARAGASPLDFNRLVLESPRRLVMPIAVYPGLALTGATVRDVVTDPQAQVEAQAALHERYRTPFVLSAMDLSAEAEAFGCALHTSENEIPSVTGRLVTSLEEARDLALPRPGDKRTRVYLEAVALLRRRFPARFVLGGCIGPFSLAARLVGVSEALELTLTEPDLMKTVLESSTGFLTRYAQSFRAAGANGLIMAEPAAGLLSPRALAAFSSAYIRQIAAAVQDEHFTIVLHNCAARLAHLPAILETGLKNFHFGAPMDITAALDQAPPDVVLCGNLDPTGVFVQLAPDQVSARARDLLAATAAHPNFVISSGCDVPPSAPLASLDALFRAVESC